MSFPRSAIGMVGATLLLVLATTGCRAPKTADRPPVNLADEVDMGPPPESAPEPPPPEAGVVKLSTALMLGGKGLSDEQTEQASDAFVASFNQGLAHFRRCYAPALQRNPELAGMISFDLILEADGSIYALELKTVKLDDPEMVRCVKRAFRKLNYGTLQEGQYFNVAAPVNFKPE